MRIVYCSTPPFADCDAPLLKAFCALGHEVHYFLHIAPYSYRTTLVDIRKPKDEFGIFPVSEFVDLAALQEYMPEVKIYIVNNPDGKNNLKAFKLSCNEKSLIRTINPDVLQYVETPAPFHLSLLWTFRSRAVCTIHDPVPHLNRMKRVERVCRRLASCIVRKFVLLNNRQTGGFCRTFHVDLSKIHYSSLGPYPCLSESAGASYPEGRYILIFGRITPYKGIEAGIAAMDAVAPMFPDVKLIIAGSGEIYFDKALYEGKPYIKIINRFVPAEEQAALIRHSLFVLCPYTEATQSGVVQTAFGLDTPVVVTDVGALADAVDNGRTGFVVPGNDIQSLADAVKYLLADESRLEQMRDSIRTGNEGQTAWLNIAEKYIKAYNG